MQACAYSQPLMLAVSSRTNDLGALPTFASCTTRRYSMGWPQTSEPTSIVKFTAWSPSASSRSGCALRPKPPKQPALGVEQVVKLAEFEPGEVSRTLGTASPLSASTACTSSDFERQFAGRPQNTSRPANTKTTSEKAMKGVSHPNRVSRLVTDLTVTGSTAG